MVCIVVKGKVKYAPSFYDNTNGEVPGCLTEIPFEFIDIHRGREMEGPEYHRLRTWAEKALEELVFYSVRQPDIRRGDIILTTIDEPINPTRPLKEKRIARQIEVYDSQNQRCATYYNSSKS